MFVWSEVLTVNLCALQSSLQYLVQVLVSETAIRLIVEDFEGIPLNVAKKIMLNNIKFGLYVYDNNNV